MKAKKKAGGPKGHSSPGGSLPNSQTPKKGPGQSRSGGGRPLHAYPVGLPRCRDCLGVVFGTA